MLRAEEQVGYASQNLEFTQDFVQMTELKFEAGDVPQMEVIRARVEAARAANQVRTAENEERLARAGLSFFMGRSPSDPSVDPRGVENPYGILRPARDHRFWHCRAAPRSGSLFSAIDRERLVKKQGYMSYLPDFDVGASKHKVPGRGGYLGRDPLPRPPGVLLAAGPG